MNEGPCKNCKRTTHPAYLRKYGGYCLDCSNAGIQDKDEEIIELRNKLAEAELLKESLFKQIQGLSAQLAQRTRAEIKERGFGGAVVEITCENCPQNGHCEFAWDHYNTNGDCLAEK